MQTKCTLLRVQKQGTFGTVMPHNKYYPLYEKKYTPFMLAQTYCIRGD